MATNFATRGNGTISHYRSVAGAGRVTSQATSESGSGSGTSEPQSARARLEGRESSLRAAMAATAMAARKSKSSRGKRERAVPLPVPPSTSSPRSRSTKGSSRQHQPQFGSTRKEKVGVQYKLPLPPLKIKVASPRYVIDAVCCVYTCRRLIDLFPVLYIHAGD